VWIPNLGASPIIASVSLTQIPCPFACFYESVSCVYTFLSACISFCVARAPCFVFCSIFITTFWVSFFVFYKFNRHLSHGAYWCTHRLANISIFIFRLHFHLSTSCIRVYQRVYALPSSSKFKYNYRYIHLHICVDYCEMTTYNMNIPITLRLCLPADRGFARCLHTFDPMFKGLHSNIRTCLCFLWMNTYHVHRKCVHSCMHLPFPYVCSSTSSLSVSIPSTWTRAHVCMFTPSLFNPNTKNTSQQVYATQIIYTCLLTHTYIMNIKK